MSKALLISIILSAVGVVALVAALVSLSQVKSGIANLQQRVEKIEALPARPATAAAGHDNSAELAKLKKELAELRALIASIPTTGGSSTGGVTMKDIRSAVEDVLASNKLREQEKEAQKQGALMTVASRKRVEEMTRNLTLDEAQKLRVQEVLNSQVEEYVKFWSNPPTGAGKEPGSSAYLEGLQRINETANAAIATILTPEQAAKYGQLPAAWFQGMGPGGPRK